MNRCARPTAEAPRRLEWPDDADASGETSEELKRLQAQFWAKFAPAIFNTRCVDYTKELE